MVTKKTVKSTVKVPEKRDNETSTEKFLRECAERAATYEESESKKTRLLKRQKAFITNQKKGTSELGTPVKKISKRQCRKILRETCPWLVRPEEIRKEVFKLIRKGHSFAFAKQLTLVLSLSFKVSDYFEALGAINPGLSKAQQDGTIEQKIWETIRELNEAWKKLIEMP